jgi:hypothetical protein
MTAMERVREYGGFIVWFLGLGYVVAWALAPERLGNTPASLHAMGLTAVAFLPWRAWVYLHGRNKPAAAATSLQAVVRDYRRVTPPPVVIRRPVKPRSQFGLRGASRAEETQN